MVRVRREGAFLIVCTPSTRPHMFIHAGPAGRVTPEGHSPVDETQVKTDQEVIRFLTTCGEENLQFLLHPPRLQKALEILDTDNSGEVDEKEWWRLAASFLYAVISSNLGRHRRDGPRPKLTGRCAQGRGHPARPLEAPGAAGGRARAEGKGGPPRGRRIQHGVPERGS